MRLLFSIAFRRTATVASRARAVAVLVLGLGLAGAGMVQAQVLSSPPGASPARKSATSPTAPPTASSAATVATPSGAPAPDAGLTLPAGQGAGVHSPNSIFPPLAPRNDVVPWSVLTQVKTQTVKNRILPVFNVTQLALHQKNQRIQGFMMPLEAGAAQKHFLLSSVPLTCSFCVPGGPESMVEVRTQTPVKYSIEPVVVEGRFQVLNDDSYGVYYRLTEAVGVK